MRSVLFYIQSLALFVCILALTGLFFACEPSSESRLLQLENQNAAEENFDVAKQLVTLYREEAKKNPKTEASFNNFVKAAELQYYVMHDAISGARWMDDAIAHYGTEEMDKSAAYVLYAEIYRDYKYKSAETVRLDIEDIDVMIANLKRDFKKVEKARAKLKTDMLIDSSMLLNPKLAERFVNVSEAMAILIGDLSPDRVVDLNIESANAARAYGNHQRAIRMYYSVYDQYPKHKRALEAMFMTAYTYDAELQDFAKAETMYKEVIEKYPNSKFAADARELIKILGRPLDEVVDEFDAK